MTSTVPSTTVPSTTVSSATVPTTAPSTTPPLPSAENPHAGQGAVLLDIGGDVGALVVTMPAAMEGLEIEIRPQAPGGGPATHSAADHAHADHGQGHDHNDNHDHAHDHSHDHVAEPHLVHVAVVGRPAGGRVVHTAVFGDLLEGEYELSQRPFGAVQLSVAVAGGEVTLADWPA